MKGKLCLASLLAAVILALACSAAIAAPRAIGGFFKQDSQANDMSRDERGEFTLFQQNFGGLAVNEEIRQSHPWLAGSIEKITTRAWQDAQKIRRNMKEEAAVFRQEAPDLYHPFEHDYDVLMCRADTFAVSFIQKEYTGGNGVHGMYGWQGVTLSAATGSRIPLAAIAKDREALAEAICTALEGGAADA